MGLFSSKKIITVASTLYNMAGPEDERPDYLKGTLFSSVMSNSDSITDDITSSYFSGPGIKQRQFFSYADRNNLAGMPETTINSNFPVDPVVVATAITAPVGQTVVVQNAQVSEGDPEEFFEKWINTNHPTRIAEDWIGDYEEATGEFTVQFPNNDVFTWFDATYDPTARYIVAKYLYVQDDNTQPLVPGTPVSVAAKQDLTSWTTISETPSVVADTLVRNENVTETYSDATPPTNTDTPLNIAVDLNTSVDIYERETFVGINGYETEGLYEHVTYTGTDSIVGGYYDQTVLVEDIGGGVTRTTTTTITGDQVDVSFDETTDTQVLYEQSVIGNENTYIYEVGTGEPTLDALVADADASGFQEFYPLLPLRLKNKALDEAPYDTNGLYEETNKAYRRATTKGIDGLLEQIEDNPDVGDIDYAYIMYGVSLNVQENACRKYIFNFFKNVQQYQTSTSTTITDFQTDITNYNNDIATLETWENTDFTGILWGDRESRPSIPSLSVPSVSSIKLRTSSPLMPSYDIRMSWVFIEDDVIAGVHAGKNIGDVSIEKGGKIEWVERSGFANLSFSSIRNEPKEIEITYMYFQETAGAYRRLTIYGLVHENFIYGGKSVKITAHEALDDTDISGFIVALHAPTVRAMSIVDYTQMATANVHILFNSYQVTKQKWYQTGIFKIFLIIVVIVIAVIVAPQLFAAGGGLLGGNLAVGAALGLTGTAALVAGVVANYLASVVISQLLSVVGTQLFGEKWGAVFAAVASFAMGAAISGFSLNAEGFLKIGNALANGYAGWVVGDINERLEDLDDKREDYEKQMDKINELIEGLSGNNLNFSPLFLTDTGRGNASSGGYTPETADEFIRRTTMTGSDVVDITYSMVYDFVEVQKTLPRN